MRPLSVWCLLLYSKGLSDRNRLAGGSQLISKFLRDDRADSQSISKCARIASGQSIPYRGRGPHSPNCEAALPRVPTRFRSSQQVEGKRGRGENPGHPQARPLLTK